MKSTKVQTLGELRMRGSLPYTHSVQYNETRATKHFCDNNIIKFAKCVFVHGSLYSGTSDKGPSEIGTTSLQRDTCFNPKLIL